jgi:hypothetical protein
MANSPVVERVDGQSGSLAYWFWCPACDTHHCFCTKRSDEENGPIWQFNDDVFKPTFAPSLRVSYGNKPDSKPMCHLFLRNGVIEYCNDSGHKLAGQKIPCELPDIGGANHGE